MSKKEESALNLNVLDEKGVYEAFNIEGNEADALTDSYFELYQLLGEEAMLKLYKHYRGDKIDCPMKLYRAEYIADLAKTATDRRQRASIARAAGYSLKFIDSVLQKRKKEDPDEEQFCALVSLYPKYVIVIIYKEVILCKIMNS